MHSYGPCYEFVCQRCLPARRGNEGNVAYDMWMAVLRITNSRFSDVLQLTYLCLCLYVHFNLLYSRGGQVLQNPAHASFMGFVQ